jgi:hypothetical protein
MSDEMLEVEEIDYETASSKRELKTVDIFDKAKKFTVLVECLQWKVVRRSETPTVRFVCVPLLYP